MNKFQWNFDRNSNIFIQENAFESVVCEMTAILSRPQCVNKRLSYSRRRNIYEKVFPDNLFISYINLESSMITDV